MRAIVVCSVLGFAAAAWGQTPPESAPIAPPPPTTAPAPPPNAPTPVVPSNAKLWLGGQLDLLLAGQIHLSANGMDVTGDAANAIGFTGVADYRVSSLVTIGFVPRFVIGVKPSGSTATSNEVDLRARVTVGKEVTPRLRLYGLGMLGYSWIFDFVTDNNGAQHTVHGFVWGLGGGLAYALKPNLALIGELSYQFGYQGGTLQGVSFTAADNFLTLGIGIMAPIE